jgi:hypothetical protein
LHVLDCEFQKFALPICLNFRSKQEKGYVFGSRAQYILFRLLLPRSSFAIEKLCDWNIQEILSNTLNQTQVQQKHIGPQGNL